MENCLHQWLMPWQNQAFLQHQSRTFCATRKSTIFAITNFSIFCNKNFLLQKMLKFLIAKMVDFRVAQNVRLWCCKKARFCHYISHCYRQFSINNIAAFFRVIDSTSSKKKNILKRVILRYSRVGQRGRGRWNISFLTIFVWHEWFVILTLFENDIWSHHPKRWRPWITTFSRMWHYITSVTYILTTKSFTTPAATVTFFVATTAGVVCF